MGRQVICKYNCHSITDVKIELPHSYMLYSGNGTMNIPQAKTSYTTYFQKCLHYIYIFVVGGCGVFQNSDNGRSVLDKMTDLVFIIVQS